MATIKDALALTTGVIDRRSFHYRNLVVLVVFTVGTSVIGAGVAWSALPLLGLLALLPLCGGFLVLDCALVNRWRTQVLHLWTADDLDLADLARCVASIRILPPGTVGALLASLPITNGPTQPPPAVRRVLAGIVTTVHQCERDRIAAWVGAYTVGAAASGIAVVTESWLPLTGGLLVLPIVLAARVAAALRWRRWLRSMNALMAEYDLTLESVAEAASQLNQGAIPAIALNQLLNLLRAHGPWAE